MPAPAPKVSFEFFPPKTESGRAAILKSVRALAQARPAFFTVTYGAGGSTREWTASMAAQIQSDTGIATAAHLTCVNTTREGIAAIAAQHWSNGIRHIVALRGDIPEEDRPLDYKDFSYYHYANELIGGLKSRHDFEISVAAYPEKHPEAPSLDADIANLKRKCDAGAARAITQFFFDNDVYFRFVERAQRAGITTPIVPGVLPVTDFDRLKKFANACSATIPAWLYERFESCGDDPERRAAAAEEILIRQCEGLVAGGAGHLHFYTLNRSDLPLSACKSCGIAL